ncbi:MAG: IS200/IS605 family transposase [Myxococcales bacterium]
MSLTELYVHFVWSTYRRNQLIGAKFEADLWSAIGAKCKELGASPIQVGGMPDHVHLLACVPPTLAISKLVREVKGGSSHQMSHRIAPGRLFRWQVGYAAFSLRADEAPIVAKYIRNQKVHHDAQTTDERWERLEPEPGDRRVRVESAQHACTCSVPRRDGFLPQRSSARMAAVRPSPSAAVAPGASPL